MSSLLGSARHYARLAIDLARGETDRARLLRRFPDVHVDRGVCVKGNLNRLQLWPGVHIQTGVVLQLGGQPWCHDQGHLSIGERSILSPHVVIYAAGPGGVVIGSEFDCGPGVGLFACRTDYERGPGHHLFAPLRIGERVTIYANAVVSPGVQIGDGAVIAANSVVTRDVPSHTLVGGSPARVLRTLAPAERRNTASLPGSGQPEAEPMSPTPLEPAPPTNAGHRARLEHASKRAPRRRADAPRYPR